jgi:hypothetical protein
VFFYFVKVTVTTGGSQSFAITQSTTYTPTTGTQYFAVTPGSAVYDSGCNVIAQIPEGAPTVSGGVATTTVTFSGAPGTYFIGLKYSAKSIVGSGPANTTPGFSYPYTIQTSGVAGSAQGLNLVHT